MAFWIKVSEKLPPEGQYVLVFRDGYFAIANIFDHDMITNQAMWSYTGLGGDPTHWAPLPEPPKEREG